MAGSLYGLHNDPVEMTDIIPQQNSRSSSTLSLSSSSHPLPAQEIPDQANNGWTQKLKGAASSLLGSVQSGVSLIANHNIIQCGPQFSVFGNDLKFTPTTIVNFANKCEKITCFPIHLELGGLVKGLNKQSSLYGLAVNQYGCVIHRNESLNPLNWTRGNYVVEKLEHIEVGVPYKKWGNNDLWDGFGYRGSVQGIVALEVGKTTEIKRQDASLQTAKDMAKEAFLTWPIATMQAVGAAAMATLDECTKAEPGQEKNNYVKDKIGGCISKMLIEGSKDKESTYWFGATIGYADINTNVFLVPIVPQAIPTKSNTGASFSLQLNNYLRKGIMVSYKNGKFNIPDDLQAIGKFFVHACGSKEDAIQQIDDIKSQVSVSIDASTLSAGAKIQAHSDSDELNSILLKSIGDLEENKGAEDSISVITEQPRNIDKPSGYPQENINRADAKVITEQPRSMEVIAEVHQEEDESTHL
ncbi:hypothetical protein [Iodobacter ciconiae]|uniref:Uncharacterized protein n=1 Tax=Iodobacter ciconiae TaxID=2496266 RepID=A0A3S8ZRS3_9NEIS|nr:hypothetical protein [Iodobacter ciconiae]AZN36189.1 hypothetical protein EJO50_06665 [Iodobacter ciconiae]